MNQCFPLVVQFPQYGTGIWRMTDAVKTARFDDAELPTPLTHASATTSIGHKLIDRLVSTMYWTHAFGPNCQLLFEREISPQSRNAIASLPDSARATPGAPAASRQTDSTTTPRTRVMSYSSFVNAVTWVGGSGRAHVSVR